MSTIDERIAALAPRAAALANAGPEYARGWAAGAREALAAAQETRDQDLDSLADFMVKRYRAKLADSPAAAMRDVAAAIREQPAPVITVQTPSALDVRIIETPPAKLKVKRDAKGQIVEVVDA